LFIIAGKFAYPILFDLRKAAPVFHGVEDGAELVFGRATGTFIQISRAIGGIS
jgi:hypothetical protein